MTDKKQALNSGPKKIHDWTVKVDRSLCIGAATCVAIAAKTFTLDSENKAVILHTSDKEAKETILDAAKGCPTAAIFIEDSKGKRIYPK